MRRILFSLIVTLAACGSDDSSPDAGPPKDAGIDASPQDAGPDASPQDAGGDASVQDAGTDAGCQPTILLVGGTNVTAQGWSIAQIAPATITYGPDYVHLETSTPNGGQSGGQLLLYRAGVLPVTGPFRLRVEMLVEAVNNHNRLDSAAAIMGSLTGTVGNQPEREEMIYLDNGFVGWSDDNPSTPPYKFTVTDGKYHVYELSRDADNTAHVTVDGVAALTRANYTTNGTIAVGDQTNDAHYDSKLSIRSVTRLCP